MNFFNSSPKESAPENENPASPAVEAKPVERQVEARSADDSMGSMVRCLYLAQSFIINSMSFNKAYIIISF